MIKNFTPTTNTGLTIALLCGLVLTQNQFAAAEDPKPAAAKVTSIKDLTYATVANQELKLDLLIPQTTTPPKLVVWIHGGGWRKGSRQNPRIKWVTDHGFALASLSYRFTPEHTFPAQIHDCKAAIRWLKNHADEYGYNADKIAVAGSSAGGQLALLLGTSGDVKELEGDLGDHVGTSSRVDAVIDYFGPSDFPLRQTTNPERALTTKSGSFALLDGVKDGKVNPQKEKDASPVTWVSSDDPALLIIHGKADDVVLVVQAERMAEVYKQANLDVTSMLHPTAKHGSKILYQGKYKDAAIRFLNRTLNAK